MNVSISAIDPQKSVLLITGVTAGTSPSLATLSALGYIFSETQLRFEFVTNANVTRVAWQVVEHY